MHVWRKWHVAELLGDLVEWGSAIGESNAVAKNLLDGDLCVGLFAGFMIDDSKNVAVMKFAAVHDMIELGIVTLEND